MLGRIIIFLSLWGGGWGSEPIQALLCAPKPRDTYTKCLWSNRGIMWTTDQYGRYMYLLYSTDLILTLTIPRYLNLNLATLSSLSRAVCVCVWSVCVCRERESVCVCVGGSITSDSYISGCGTYEVGQCRCPRPPQKSSQNNCQPDPAF